MKKVIVSVVFVALCGMSLSQLLHRLCKGGCRCSRSIDTD